MGNEAAPGNYKTASDKTRRFRPFILYSLICLVLFRLCLSFILFHVLFSLFLCPTYASHMNVFELKGALPAPDHWSLESILKWMIN